jgi:splicing factor U2AF 65 kDa subunit
MGLGSNLNPAVKLGPDGSIISGISGGMVSNQVTRHARRLYVGGIPPNSTENDIANFFRTVISQSLSPRELDGKDPVVSVFINREKSFAFVELQTIELTTACCRLDGMSYAGNPLRIRRPNDYQPERVPTDLGPIPTISLTALGVVSTSVPDGPNKIFVGGLPHELGEDEIKELLMAFGPLRAFHLVKEPGTNTSKGYAFCEYLDPNNTNIAIMGLNNLPVCDKILTVKPASQNATSMMSSTSGAASIYGPGPSSGGGNPYAGGGGGYGAPDYSNPIPTRVLTLPSRTSL